MRSAAILALILAACSSTQSSAPPPPPPSGDDVAPPAPAPAGRTPAIPEDHPLYGRVEGEQKPGECADDAACVVGGCSAEVCSTEQVQTTCEARDWPTKGASCGCVSGQCMWYRDAGAKGDDGASGDAGAKGDGGDVVVEEFQAISNKMCACADSNCAETVNKEFEDWLRRNEKVKGTAAQQERAKTIAEQYTKCMMAAMAEAPGQGQTCGVNDRCAGGLTCVKYYGVAGAAGPQLSSCEIPCGKGKAACPTGQSCRIVADGPGQVCRP